MTRHPGGRTCNSAITKPIVWLVSLAALLVNVRHEPNPTPPRPRPQPGTTR